jgi:hypothetical protein
MAPTYQKRRSMLKGIKNGYIGCFSSFDRLKIIHHFGLIEITTIGKNGYEISFGNVQYGYYELKGDKTIIANVKQWGEIMGIPSMFNHIYIQKSKYETA